MSEVTAVSPAAAHAVTPLRLTPPDRLDALSAPEWRQETSRYIDQGVSHFVVDLSATAFVDSAGMAALVSLLKQARTRGGDVKLVWPRREPVQRILRLTRFDRVFDIVPSGNSAA